MSLALDEDLAGGERRKTLRLLLHSSRRLEVVFTVERLRLEEQSLLEVAAREVGALQLHSQGGAVILYSQVGALLCSQGALGGLGLPIVLRGAVLRGYWEAR